MKGPVVFDGSILGAGPITGVAGSFLTTLRAYAENARCELILLLPEGVEPPTIPGVSCRPGPQGFLAKQRRLPKLLREYRAQVYHSPVAAIPLRALCPTSATIHDLPWLSPLLKQEPGSRLRQRWAVKLAGLRATAILVPSKATASDLAQYLGEGVLSRTHVVHHGCVRPDQPADERQLVGPFLVLGDDRPRKNLARLKEAHALAQEKARGTDGLPTLRLVGPPDAYVSESRKWEILRSSRALLQLSLWEGFGLPVLEAFAHGVPVLCSKQKSLEEVAGDAALFADPLDIEDMATAIGRLHRDEELRQTLRLRGLKRILEFPPERPAQAWRELHEQLAS